MEKFCYREVEAATKGFALERLIGKGSHGCVYKGVLKSGKLVAVKKASPALQRLQDYSKLNNEIDILSSLRSPHIVNLVGVSQNPDPKLLVIEFMPNGSLYQFLHNSPDPPTWFRRMMAVLQIAEAIQALHEAKPPVIHRDVKSANILFDSQWNARLGDFSLAVRTESADSAGIRNSEEIDGSYSNWSVLSPTPPAGTFGYLDPCYTTPGRLSTKNDIFSFGVVLLETISGRRALDVRLEPASIVGWAMPLIKGDRMGEICDMRVSLPNSIKCLIPRMLSIAARCVVSKVERRPGMTEIVTELRSVVESCRSPIWGLLRSNLLRKRYPYIRAKRKRTTTIICRNQTYDEDGVAF